MPLPPPSLATIGIAGATPMRVRLARPSGRGPELYHRTGDPGTTLAADDRGRAQAVAELVRLVVAASALPLRTVVAVQPAWLGTTTMPLGRPEPRVDHDLTVLPGAGHGFFWPSSTTHDADARADAWEIMLRELKR